MANTHLTSNQTVHEGVNSMVSYNDTVLRSKRKKIFAAFFIPCLIIGVLLAVAFGFRDFICNLIGIEISISAPADDNDGDDNIDIFLAAVNGLSGNAASSGFDFDAMTFKITNGTTYDRNVKNLILEGLPSDATKVEGGQLIVDVDKTAEQTGLNLNNIEDLKAQIVSLYNDKKLVTVTEIKEAGRYYVTWVIDDIDYDAKPDVLGNGGSVDKYRQTTVATPSYIVIDKATLPDMTVSVSNATIAYDGNTHEGNFVIDNLPLDDTIKVERNIVEKVSGASVPNPKDSDIYLLKSVKFTSRNYTEKEITYTAGEEPTLTITKKNIASDITFNSIIREYTGLTSELRVQGEIPTGVETKYYISGSEVTTADLDFKNVTDTVTVTAVLNGRNHEAEVIATVKITPANLTAHIELNDVLRDYDPDNETVIEAVITNPNFTDLTSDYIKYYDVDSGREITKVEDRTFKNCSDAVKKIRVEIKGNDNYVDYTKTVSIRIRRIPLPADITFPNLFATYNGEEFPAVTVKNAPSDVLPTYYEVMATGELVEIPVENLKFKDVCDKKIVAKFSSPNYNTSLELMTQVTIIPASLNGIVSMDSVARPYDKNKADEIKVKVAPGYEKLMETVVIKYYDENNREITDLSKLTFKDACDTSITAKFFSSNIVPDYSITTNILITKLQFETITRPTNLSAFKNLNKEVFDPKSVYTNLDLPEGTEVTYTIYYDKNNNNRYEPNETVTKINKLGSYKIDYKFENPNYVEQSLIIPFEVMFNPLIIPVGVILGLIIPLLILLFAMPAKRRKDRKSRQHFIAIRTQLEAERGGVICESYAKSKDKFSRKKGRLYLTAKALEFYDKNYNKNYRNTVILARDITDIKCQGAFGGKLIILSRGGVQKFKVPAGTAKLWKKELLQFKYMEQCYYSEVHVLNSTNNEKPAKEDLKAEKKRKIK